VLLWVFTDATLGFTTSYPAVARVSPLTNAKTDPSGAKWVAVFGSGPTGYDARSTQRAQFYAVDLVAGPSYQPSSGAFRGVVYSTGDTNSFMGDITALDANLDYRVDVLYAGNVICNSATVSPCSGGTPVWVGKLYRLTTGGARAGSPDPTNLAAWGLTASGAQVPTVLLATFTCGPTPCTGSTPAGPITASPALTADNNNNFWVFFGTGRFFSQNDKTTSDPQYAFGVKDPVANSTACTESTTTSCQKNNLLDVSNVSVCLTGVGTCGTTTSQVTGISGITDYSSLVNRITNTTNPALSMDGWFVTLPNAGERSLSKPTVLGGSVFFTTFLPVTDLCTAAGTGNLYALYYLTGGAYTQSMIGTSPSGTTTTINRSLSLGTGLPSAMAVQIGAQGTGASGVASSAGCAGRLTGYIQASTGVLGQVCGQPALSLWSRLISWRDL
jgi:type IV pilus assembly protein PilY1